MTATALLRSSKHYPAPVICAVFTDTDISQRNLAIEVWKNIFIGKFPEFQYSQFTQIDVDLI